MSELELYPGHPYPLGPTWDGKGVNFSIYAGHATAVELCLFEENCGENYAVVNLFERSSQIWLVYIPGIRPEQCYGYRVYGPFDPLNGQRFNPNKLLIDPYAKAISGSVNWHESLYGYKIGEDDLTFSDRDSAPFVPKSVVIDPAYDWEDVKAPNTSYHKSIIYEAHVKGLTKLHPDIPEEIRGTYSAIAHPVIIDHLKSLGVTAIELMPIHQFINDEVLVKQGLNNYWGYNTIGFFSPDTKYSSKGTLG